MLCGYVLPDINFDESSATEYSQENCVSGQTHSGSYNSETLTCDDTAEKYTRNNIRNTLLYTGIGLLGLVTVIVIFVYLDIAFHIKMLFVNKY